MFQRPQALLIQKIPGRLANKYPWNGVIVPPQRVDAGRQAPRTILTICQRAMPISRLRSLGIKSAEWEDDGTIVIVYDAVTSEELRRAPMRKVSGNTMSGTRSTSRAAPATDRALLIVAHGSPSEPIPQEDALRGLAREVATQLPGWRVDGATLAAEGAFEAAAARLGRPLVYPFFMSEGWFTGHALARRVAALGLSQLAPFGVAPDLPDIAAERIRAEMRTHGWDAGDTALVLAAHGSARSKTSADAPFAFARRLEAALTPRSVSLGFVEQAPYLEQASRDLGQALCLAFFALRSGHVDNDLPRALAAAGFNGPVLPPFIEWAETAGVIARDTLRQIALSK